MSTLTIAETERLRNAIAFIDWVSMHGYRPGEVAEVDRTFVTVKRDLRELMVTRGPVR